MECRQSVLQSLIFSSFRISFKGFDLFSFGGTQYIGLSAIFDRRCMEYRQSVLQSLVCSAL